MFTPQQIQEVSFERALFGGYDMASVNEFFGPLTEDYIALYKENAVLKSKMRILVEKLEEYRNQEGSMKNAIVAAQKTCDEMVADAQRKSAKILNEAEQSARVKSDTVDEAVDAEIERLDRAKAATEDFIRTVEAEIKRQLDCLNSLRLMDLTPSAKREREKIKRPSESTDQIASQIEQNMEKLVGKEEPAVTPLSKSDTKVMPPLSDKFNDLQFGKNYTPKQKSGKK